MSRDSHRDTEAASSQDEIDDRTRIEDLAAAMKAAAYSAALHAWSICPPRASDAPATR
jgi:hypothetical protein